jgi:hypothetical protein
MICDRGHFHTSIDPPTMFVGIANLIMHGDQNKIWHDSLERDVFIDMAAHASQEARNFIYEESDGETITDKSLRELLDEDSDLMITLIAKGLGLSPKMTDRFVDGDIH